MNEYSAETHDRFRPIKRVLVVAAATGIGTLLLLGGINIAYKDKIYPGVRAEGVLVGGMKVSSAEGAIKAEVDRFEGELLTLEHGDRILRIPVAKLGLTYDPAASARRAYLYGRQGSIFSRLHAQLRALLGRDTAISNYSYDEAQLSAYLGPYLSDIVEPVRDASLSYDAERMQVVPAQQGRRVDIGRLTLELNDRLASLKARDIKVPVYPMEPQIPTKALERATARVQNALSGPFTLVIGERQEEVPAATLVKWLQVDRVDPVSRLTPSYTLPAQVTVAVDEKAVRGYVDRLAASTDQQARNAIISFSDGKVTVLEESRTGRTLDRDKSVAALTEALMGEKDKDEAASRRIELSLTETKAEVRGDNLESLGIKELISQGVSYFPGSTASRIINVRTGAAKYDGLLIKPGQVFSFNEYLGNVDAASGFVQEKVIIGNKIEKQYGGGLCQVSSTAYRAALLAGLPILERHNHSYAVSYYTAPYNAPGLDATIYAPQIDMKFRNDTGAYILIQTRLEGTALKFDFYGTKTKVGVIRGPEFVSGSNDASKPSHTVFYRDVVDMAGKVLRSDPVHTHYKPSGEFSDKPQYN